MHTHIYTHTYTHTYKQIQIQTHNYTHKNTTAHAESYTHIHPRASVQMSGYILYTWILLSWLTNPFLRSTSSLSGGLPTIPCRHHIIACLYNTKAWKSMKASSSKRLTASPSLMSAPPQGELRIKPRTHDQPTLVCWQILNSDRGVWRVFVFLHCCLCILSNLQVCLEVSVVSAIWWQLSLQPLLYLLRASPISFL